MSRTNLYCSQGLICWRSFNVFSSFQITALKSYNSSSQLEAAVEFLAVKLHKLKVNFYKAQDPIHTHSQLGFKVCVPSPGLRLSSPCTLEQELVKKMAHSGPSMASDWGEVGSRTRAVFSLAQ